MEKVLIRDYKHKCQTNKYLILGIYMTNINFRTRKLDRENKKEEQRERERSGEEKSFARLRHI